LLILIWSHPLNPETEIPSSRIAFFGGIRCFSRSRAGPKDRPQCQWGLL